MTSEITDKSLLRCTVKKSVHVTKRLVVCASYALVAATSIVIIGFGVSNILPPLIIALWSVLTSLVTPLWSLLITIPWYYYAGTALIGAIPVYSFLWCVARDLTEEDWKSNSANKSAFAVSALAFSAIALALAFSAIAFAFVIALALAFSAIAITTTIAAISINAVAVDNVSEITVWYYIFRFPGAAWHHYIRGDHP